VSKPSELVQGTLDMLILKILALEPLNGWAISQRLKQISSDVLRLATVLSTLRCTSWNNRVGLLVSGSRAETTVAPSSIR